MVNRLQKYLTERFIDIRHSSSIEIVGKSGVMMVFIIYNLSEIEEVLLSRHKPG